MFLGLLLQSLLCVAVLAQGRYEMIHRILQAKCVYPTSVSLPVTSFAIELDQPTITLTSNDVSVVEIVGNNYNVQSVGNIVPTDGEWTARINVWYSGTSEPQVTCRALSQAPAVTTTTAGPTQSPPCQGLLPYCFEAEILNSWNVQGGVRFDGVCKFRVTETTKQHTTNLGLMFSQSIVNFETWVMTKISPTGNSGDLFLMDNTYEIHPDTLRASFQATGEGNSVPTVYCMGDLQPY